jgi:hypothetical protein
MKRLFTTQAIGVLAILLGGCIGIPQAQDREPAMVVPKAEADIASGAVEDTLRACRARIPKDASIGQLMIAEQSCWRDENDRKPVEAVPGARSSGLAGPADMVLLKSIDRGSVGGHRMKA